MESVTIPQLYCPFPSRLNPHAAAVHQGTLDWVQHFRFVSDEAAFRRIRATRIGWLAGRFHPNAPREMLQLVSDWYIWMFFRDDQRDESALGKDPKHLEAVNARYLEILSGQEPQTDEGSLAHAMRDLRDRLAAVAGTRVWMRRFIRIVQEHFDSTVWEATNRLRGAAPDVATYIRMRPITGGLHVDAALIEVAQGTRLPPEVQSHTVVQQLTVASNNVVCWANDIVSLQKEMRSGDLHNLILVLQQAYDLSLPAATGRALMMHNAEVQTFIELTQQLPTLGTATVDVNLQRYVSTLRARIRGNLDWSLESGRYRTPSIEPRPEIVE